MDSALNYILEGFNERNYSVDKAKDIFIEKMSEWEGQNKLEFFKSEVPEEYLDSYDPNDPMMQELVWDNIVKRGLACIDVYVKEILPNIKRVISVQNSGHLTNDEGDEFIFIVDFIAEIFDGRIVLLDNKTSSARYPKTKIAKSQQLALYLESFPEIKYAGYCVLIKNPEKEKGVTHQFMVGEIPEENKQAVFDHVQEIAQNIKEEKFPMNPKGCMAFGKKCEYWNACKFGNTDGLIPAYPEKKKEET